MDKITTRVAAGAAKVVVRLDRESEVVKKPVDLGPDEFVPAVEASAAYGVLLPDAGYSGRATFVIGKDGKLLWREISDNMGDMEHVPSPERALAAIARA